MLRGIFSEMMKMNKIMLCRQFFTSDNFVAVGGNIYNMYGNMLSVWVCQRKHGTYEIIVKLHSAEYRHNYPAFSEFVKRQKKLRNSCSGQYANKYQKADVHKNASNKKSPLFIIRKEEIFVNQYY